MSGLATTLYPKPVVTVEAEPWMWDGPLTPGEIAQMSSAVERRQREFRAGRNAARAAMVSLGYGATELLSGPDRAPVWPSGLAGSISHTSARCIVALCPKGEIASVGIDIEEVARVRPEFTRYVVRPGEPVHTGFVDPQAARAAQFSAKEAVYKALYPMTQTFMGFHDVFLLSLGPVSFRARIDVGSLAGIELDGILELVDGLVCAGVTISSSLTERAAGGL